MGVLGDGSGKGESLFIWIPIDVDKYFLYTN
jgi:hypothetical protein